MSRSDSSADDQSMELGETTGQLAGYLADLTYDDLPQEAVELEKRHLLDTLGCILYGTTTPWVRKVVDALEANEETGHGSVSVPTTGIKLPPARAALVNGTASHSMDYDDYCQDAGVHAGSAIVPATLSYVQSTDRTVSGKDAITALTGGVEVAVRSGYGIGRGSLFDGWHIAGWTDAFGGAATAGLLMGLDREKMAHSLALAGTQGAGLMGAAYGAEVKRFHMGKAAESGYLGAMLAEQSFTGDTKIFTERWGGIGQTMSDDYDIPAVTEGLGDTYEFLSKLTFKPFPSVGQTHPPATAIRLIVEENGLDTDEITNVRVRVTETAKEKAGWDFEPEGVMSAQGNMQYAIGTYLVDGEIRIDAYTEEAIRRPAVLKRIENIEIIPDPDLVADDASFNSRYKTTVEADTVDGSTYSATVSQPPGFPENPMSDEELIEKFTEQAEYVLDDEDIDAIVNFVLNVEDQDDFAELFEYLD